MPIRSTSYSSQKVKRSKTALRDIKNDEDLMNIPREDLDEALQESAENLLERLRYYIGLYAYSDDNEWYAPTGEFLNAWEIHRPEKELSFSIRYNPTGNLYRGEENEGWTHGSHFEGWGTAVPYMADLLNTIGGTSRMGWNNRKFAYWDEFLKEEVEGGRLEEGIKTSINLITRSE